MTPDQLRADAYRRLLVSLYHHRRTSPSTLRMMVEDVVTTLGDHGDLDPDDEEMAEEYAHTLALRRREAEKPPEQRDKQDRITAYVAMDLSDRIAFLNWLRKGEPLRRAEQDFFADLGLMSMGEVTPLGRAVADGIFKRLSKADRAQFEETTA